jgi:hypothetical protein
MRRESSRPFRILDGVVLIAATGVGLAGWRFWFAVTDSGWDRLWPTGDLWKLERWLIAAQWAAPVASIMLLSWTGAVLLLRLGPGRPRRRRLWSQPGFLACVAVVLAFALKSVGVGFDTVRWFLTTSPARLSNVGYGAVAGQSALMVFSNHPVGSQAKAGQIILLFWLVIWAGGRCRPEPSWIDRSGRALGVAWVCLSAVDVFYAFWR